MRTIELRQKRADLIARAGTLISQARNDGRNLTADEQANFDRLHTEADTLLGTIDREERQARLDAEMLETQAEIDGTSRTGAGALEDCILAPGESYVQRAEREHGPDDCRFSAMLQATLTGRTADLRESERRALSTSISGDGGLMVPTGVSAQILDALSARSRVMEAGIRRGIVPGQVGEFTVPKLDAPPAVAWTQELQTLSESDVNFTGLVVRPRTLTCGPILVSRQLLDRSPVDIERWLVRAISETMAREVDRVAMFGSGIGAEPEGIVGRLDTSHVETSVGALTTYDDLLDAIEAIETDDSPEATAGILHPRESITLAKLKETDTDAPLARPARLLNFPLLSTTATPAGSMIVGHWPSATVWAQDALRVMILRERYADRLAVGLIVYLYADVSVEYPESFVSLSGITV